MESFPKMEKVAGTKIATSRLQVQNEKWCPLLC